MCSGQINNVCNVVYILFIKDLKKKKNYLGVLFFLLKTQFMNETRILTALKQQQLNMCLYKMTYQDRLPCFKYLKH